MRSLSWFLFSVPFILCFIHSSAYADRRGRGRSYSPPVQYHVVPTTPPTQPSPPRYEEDPKNISGVEFNYRYALKNPTEDHLKIKLNVTDPGVLANIGKVFARVRYFDLSDDSNIKEVVVPISFEESGRAILEVKDLRPEAVFKMDIDLFVPTPGDPQQSKLLVNAGSYWGVTSGKSDVAKARHKITTTMLLEYNDWAIGRRGHSNAPYLDMPGGWCGLFPQWCSKPYIKVFDEEPSDSYSAAGTYFRSFQTPAPGEAIHGNYGLLNAHKFTVLGYSPKSGNVYTVEGNFGNRVGLNVRSTGEFHGYGKINEKILWGAAQARREEPVSE